MIISHASFVDAFLVLVAQALTNTIHSRRGGTRCRTYEFSARLAGGILEPRIDPKTTPDSVSIPARQLMRKPEAFSATSVHVSPEPASNLVRPGHNRSSSPGSAKTFCFRGSWIGQNSDLHPGKNGNIGQIIRMLRLLHLLHADTIPNSLRCSCSVSSSAGNIDSIRNSCAATVCGVPTVVTSEK